MKGKEKYYICLFSPETTAISHNNVQLQNQRFERIWSKGIDVYSSIYPFQKIDPI